jgi:hypothetical protein
MVMFCLVNITEGCGINMNREPDLELEEPFEPSSLKGFHGEELKAESAAVQDIFENDLALGLGFVDASCVNFVDALETTMTVSPKLDRFDFEEDVLRCWNVVDDLQVLNTAVLESTLSPDYISNVLVGLQQLYQLKFEKLWQTFETLNHNGDL